MSPPGNGEGDARVPGREDRKPLPKRFYKVATAERGEAVADGWLVLLDGRPALTPGRKRLEFASEAMAAAIAAEWSGQGETLEPQTMPLTRLVNTAIDGVTGKEAAVAADIAAFAGTDLVCYRAESPQQLVVEQAHAWDPVLGWARRRLGVRFKVASGIVHVAQDRAALAAVGEVLAGKDAFQLTALHVMTTLTGSALIALAHADGFLDASQAWRAAHVDEDWQIRQWGEDAEAAARRDRRRGEMEAASTLLRLATDACAGAPPRP